MPFEFAIRAAAALFLIVGALQLSHRAVVLLSPHLSLLLRWCAVAVVGMWISTLAFHLLLWAHAFCLVVACAALALSLSAMSLFGRRASARPVAIGGDLARWTRVGRVLWKSRFGWAHLGLAAAAAVTTARGLLVPPLGWDTITYHAVKAAMWIQNAGPITMEAPGGWSIYGPRMGGGEIFSAWAMLPLGTDLLAGLVEAVQWLALGLFLVGLGRELGLRGRHRLLGASYALFIPVVYRLVGSGYVELALHGTLAAGLLFGLRFATRREGVSLLYAAMALGVAAGVKLSAVPLAGVVGMVGVVALLAYGATDGKRLRWLVASGLAAAAPLAPWLIAATLRTGHPLSPEPVAIGGLTLGVGPASWEGLQTRLAVEPYTPVFELLALARVFGPPGFPVPVLSALSVLPVVLALVCGSWRLRRAPVALFLVVGFVVLQFAVVYSPAMSPIRLGTSGSVARLDAGATCVAAVLSLLWCRGRGLLEAAYVVYLRVAIAIHIVVELTFGWAPLEYRVIPVATLALALVAAALPGLWRQMSRHGRRVQTAAAAAVALLVVAGLDRVVERFRWTFVRDSYFLHRMPRYWADAARDLDTPEEPRRIAITAGRHPHLDRQFMYFFMGRRLQNELFYVPIRGDGRITSHIESAGKLHATADFDRWLARLDEAGITEVVSFAPLSAELIEMERRRDRFEHLRGEPRGRWATYRLRRRR